jgi:hypothetical protein
MREIIVRCFQLIATMRNNFSCGSPWPRKIYQRKPEVTLGKSPGQETRQCPGRDTGKSKIIAVLRMVQAGERVADICCKVGSPVKQLTACGRPSTPAWRASCLSDGTCARRTVPEEAGGGAEPADSAGDCLKKLQGLANKIRPWFRGNATTGVLAFLNVEPPALTN